MSPEPPRNICPLYSFELKCTPKTTHNIAWSPDLELAVAANDSVFIFIPDFSEPQKKPRPGYDICRQYGEVALRFPIGQVRSPELNRPLYDTVGQEYPQFEDEPEFIYAGAGSGVVTGHGSSLNHVVALDWSPCGLGRMNRSALAVLTGGGILTIYCEGASDGMGSAKLGGGNPRSLRSWVTAWCVGGGLLVPAVEGHNPFHGREYVTALAWARDISGGGALMAYANDEDEVVVLSVQARHDPRASPGSPGQWRVEEVARFSAQGPHEKTNPIDPDHSPSGSSFSLSWSPWLNKGGSKASMISYVTKNYVGFRQVTLKPSGPMEAPKVQLADVDANGVCLYLAPDAFVVWEDLIWTIGTSKICRGIIATPARVQAFSLAFDVTAPYTKHATDECETTYPTVEDSTQCGNPITGLIVHPPSLSQTTESPSYTLVRLSATYLNNGWQETNLPLPSNPEDPDGGPQWATEIAQIIHHQLPRALLNRPPFPSGSDSDDDEYETDNFTEDEDSDPDAEIVGKTNYLGFRIDVMDQVYTGRARIWGITTSPGRGTSAVFISRHSATEYERDSYGGLDGRILFGKHNPGESGDGDDTVVPLANLSTEARMWEWMYGNGPPVPGITIPSANSGDGRIALKDNFMMTADQQLCPFCETRLTPDGKRSRCGSGHTFSLCAATGVPILAPGISNACGVCGYKCLKQDQLFIMAPQLRDIIAEEISAEFCGGCGGKFLN